MYANFLEFLVAAKLTTLVEISCVLSFFLLSVIILINLSRIKFSISLHVSRNSIRSEPCF